MADYNEDVDCPIGDIPSGDRCWFNDNVNLDDLSNGDVLVRKGTGLFHTYTRRKKSALHHPRLVI